MSLTKQVHLYSVCTDAFYDEQEQYCHNRLLKLYGLRKSAEKIRDSKREIKELMRKNKDAGIDWYHEM